METLCDFTKVENVEKLFMENLGDKLNEEGFIMYCMIHFKSILSNKSFYEQEKDILKMSEDEYYRLLGKIVKNEIFSNMFKDKCHQYAVGNYICHASDLNFKQKVERFLELSNLSIDFISPVLNFAFLKVRSELSFKEFLHLTSLS